jgi:MFS family permease
VSAVVVLAFWGPFEVLVPYIVKNDLAGGADDLGLVFALGGVGSLVAAVAIGQLGLPRRWFTVMALTWSASTAAVAAYAFVEAAWQAMAISFVVNAVSSVSFVVWNTMMHKLVPEELRGRVMSLASLSFVGTLPVSFALTGPVAAAIGVEATLVGAGIVGGAVAALVLFLPGVRAVERPEAPALEVSSKVAP